MRFNSLRLVTFYRALFFSLLTLPSLTIATPVMKASAHTEPSAEFHLYANSQPLIDELKNAGLHKRSAGGGTIYKALPTPLQKRLWNLQNADIRSVANEVARISGKNFLIDPRVKGKISIIASTPLSNKEIYQVFLSALAVHGYSAIPSGKVIKIVPSTDSRFASPPLANRFHSGMGDEIVVRVIPVKYVSAQQLVPILRPLMPHWTHIAAYNPSNALILAGRANNLKRMLSIIKRVDTPSEKGINYIPLHYAIAQDVVRSLQHLQINQHELDEKVAIAADDRSNAILLSGNKRSRLRMKVLISELDTPSKSGVSGNTEVIYLHYMPAKQLVPILAGVAKSQFSGIVETIIGSQMAKTASPTLDFKSSASGFEDQFKHSSSSSDHKPRIEIIAEPNTNSVILNAPPTILRNLKSVIAKLDIRPAQVAVEALIVEINEGDINQLGVDWGAVVTDASGLMMNGFKPGVGIITKNGFQEFQAVITALAQKSKADILSTPSLVVLDNHIAHIKVGKEVSVENTSYPGNANGTTVANPFITLKRENAALILNVTPQISKGNTIKLEIAHTNKTLQDPDDTSGRPVFNVSEITTSVIVNDGDVLVLGGLIQNQLRDVDKKIPILGDIPLLGRLFHNKSKIHDKKKLMIFLRPTILHNQRESMIVTNSKYNDIREDQLQILRHRPYMPDHKEHVLPRLKPIAHLPKPFSQN